MSLVTTHVLDNATGRPAAGVPVRLEARDGGWSTLAESRTDADGRARDLGPERLPAGVYRLVFDIESDRGEDAFFPEITVCFRLGENAGHHHVPVLLSPFAYTTYRGS
ncbi:5-hydroxyisourate hydrolase [Prauserella shujinwangii]|uniref:5-hydroxyisourate hydrolase n=1 Tax=Prauserella shujinwangii TaxID=1453103 RepID=A0A2T0LWG9_9PSEU|nr:hydroxyisourate hydrolase [Prauserella shujinwangii]PRX48372.1 5-hydroxyisourate hydrolase [Prauserella shujinwangii]